MKKSNESAGANSVQGALVQVARLYYDREGRIIESGLEKGMIAAGVNQLKAIGCLAAVACGVDKAVAVLGALRTGLISALFIGQAMAEKILAGFAPANREL
jgi:DNA-binding transcriptional regulator LsrR (DeoR family)